MSTEFAEKCLFIACLICLSGSLLILVHSIISHSFKRSRDKEWMRFLAGSGIKRLRDTMLEFIDRGMDILPEKVIKARERIDQDKQNWTR